MRHGALRIYAGLLCAFAVCIAGATQAADPPSDHPSSDLERAVKAAYLYKFLNYVEWPPSAFADDSAPFVIGVYGADAIAAQLTQLAAEHDVAGRRVEVRRLKRYEPLAGVHVLFVGAQDAAQLPALVRAVRQRALLLVSEEKDGLDAGSAINLVVDDDHVRFDIAPENAERMGVHLSSRLLAVARTVRDRGTDR
ncbi:MAG: YfiR family protein [Casimicrobiaceae bacterium]